MELIACVLRRRLPAVAGCYYLSPEVSYCSSFCSFGFSSTTTVLLRFAYWFAVRVKFVVSILFFATLNYNYTFEVRRFILNSKIVIKIMLKLG